jgi:hypothetical protein
MRKILRKQKRLREELRKRFRSEYLGQLVQRPGNGRRLRDIKLGDIVLIESGRRGRIFGLRRE